MRKAASATTHSSASPWRAAANVADTMSPAPMPAAATSRPGPIAVHPPAAGGETAGASPLWRGQWRCLMAALTILWRLPGACVDRGKCMEKLNGAEAAVRMLQLNGVRHIFGLCGDTSLPFYDALYRMEHGMTHVLTRDERSAAYMADGYARVTRQGGVCEGPSGGGATYLLPGLVEANESSIPVLGITSDVPVLSRGRYPLTELDQEALYRPLTKWNTVCDRAEQIPQAIRSAFRADDDGPARAPRTSACRTTCMKQHGRSGGALGAARPRSLSRVALCAPNPAAIEAAAEAILKARAPGVHLRRRRDHRGRHGRARQGRDAAQRAGLHDGERQGQPRRKRIRSAWASSARTAASSPTREVVQQADLVDLRRLPRRLDDDRALEESVARHSRSSTSTSIPR